MRKLFAKLHLWLSIPLGLLISVVCLSGAALVFEKEITRALQPAVQQTERAEKGGKPRPLPFFRTMRQLHRWLMDVPPRKGEPSTGKTVVGITTLAMAGIIVSGLVLWIPRNRRMLGNRFRVSCGKGWRRFCYDSHVVLGFYAALFLLVMALTGLTWSFGWYRTAAYALFDGVATHPSGTLKGWFYALHTGSWGGLWTKTLYFLAALIGGILPLSGYYLWYKRTRAARKSRRTVRRK